MRQQLDSLVQTKNVKGLNSWLCSANTEKQVYGADGLFQLKRKGVKLTQEQQRIIQVIQNKNGDLKTCIGCIYLNADIGFIVREIIAGKKF